MHSIRGASCQPFIWRSFSRAVLAAVQAGFQTRHIATVAITIVTIIIIITTTIVVVVVLLTVDSLQKRRRRLIPARTETETESRTVLVGEPPEVEVLHGTPDQGGQLRPEQALFAEPLQVCRRNRWPVKA